MTKTALCVVILLASIGARSGAQGLRATLTNTEPFDRTGEVVGIPLDMLRPHSARTGETGLTAIALPEGRPLPVQQTAEELLVQIDVAAGQSVALLIRPGAPAPSEPRVDGRFVLPREDYAWENDRVAFRIYGPAQAGPVRNGIDVWTKRVRSLIVEKWYRESEGSPPGKDTYHTDRGEGADFFSVGRSLGAGAAALWSGGSIHQPGVFSSSRTIADGPLRVQFELVYDSIRVDGEPYAVTCRITLDAGSNLNRIDVRYAGTDGDLVVASGLVRRPGTEVRRSDEECWLSLWGPTTADTATGFLGTGVIIPPARWVGWAQDSLHHLALGRARAGAPFTYYAGAGWTRSGDFATEEEWIASLSRQARALAAPVRVAIERE